MIPIQLVRVTLGKEVIQVPLFRLPYANANDGAHAPGGFFTDNEGEFGVILDARLSPEEAQRVATAEIEKNAPFLAAALLQRRESSPSMEAPHSSRSF